MLTLDEVNAFDPETFTVRIRPVFEHSPWIAARTAAGRPFATREALHAALCRTVSQASDDEKLALIRALPDLAGRSVLTRESQAEQKSAGLDHLSAEEIERFTDFNRRYREKFGFPFVICARRNKKETILAAMPVRLQNSREKEIETALAEVCQIAELRLRDLIP
jgi:2-oxo-4-hydroxy-4-carboxy-5-ureidoimidazoline decarboxylase